MNPVPLRSGGLKENAAARCRGHPSPSSRPVRSAGAAWARRPEQHTARLPGAVPEPPASGAARSHAFPASVCLAGTRCGEPAMPERASSFPPQQLRNDRRAPRPPRHRRKGRLQAALRPAPLRLSASGPLVQHQIVAEAAGLPRPCAAHPSAAPGGAVQCSAPHCGCRTARSRRATQPPRCADATYTRLPPRPRRSVDRAQPLGAFQSGQEQSGGSVLLKTWGLGKRGILGRCYVVASSHRNRTSRLQNLKPMDS